MAPFVGFDFQAVITLTSNTGQLHAFPILWKASADWMFGVRHEVARVFIKDDPVFCHRDRTGTCVGVTLGCEAPGTM